MVDAAHADVVAILTRAPSAGGKSRLCRELGLDVDHALLRALLLDTLDNTADPRFTRLIAVDPASACDEVAQLAPGIPVIPQLGDDLGARMASTMSRLLDGGARRVALIGSDVPEIRPEVIVRAFALLRHEPDAVVLGPSFDGGYYLIAASRVPPVFHPVAWGGASVRAETCALAARAGVSVRLLEEGGDVDSVADVRRAIRSGRVARTAEWAQQIGIIEGNSRN